VSLLLCDLDDSLVDRSAVFSAWAHQFAQIHGQDEAFVDWMVSEDRSGYRPKTEFFGALQERLALSETVSELEARYQEDYISLFRPDGEVSNALLDARRAGWKIAIVTNSSNIELQLAKIRAVEITPLVDAIVVSGAEGIRKPDPRLLRLAADRCGHSLEDAWMIGDSPDHDIGASAAAGIHSVWLSRGRSWPRSDYQPEIEAQSFPDAVRLVLHTRS
jgi:HAD superfamily hydrolase (TIGR01549 family)